MSEDSERRKLEGLASAQDAMVTQMQTTRRYFQLYTPSMPPELFNHEAWISALRAQVAAQPRIRMQFILPPAKDWRRSCPQFINLAERLRTAVQLRCLPDTEPRDRELYQRLFAVGDRSYTLEMPDLQRFAGNTQPRSQARGRQLLTFFQEIWEKSSPDAELRRLMI